MASIVTLGFSDNNIIGMGFNPDLTAFCKLEAYLTDFGIVTASGDTHYMQVGLRSIPQNVSNAVLKDHAIVAQFNTDLYASVYIRRGAIVDIVIPTAGFAQVLTVPDQALYNVKGLLE